MRLSLPPLGPLGPNQALVPNHLGSPGHPPPLPHLQKQHLRLLSLINQVVARPTYKVLILISNLRPLPRLRLKLKQQRFILMYQETFYGTSRMGQLDRVIYHLHQIQFQMEMPVTMPLEIEWEIVAILITSTKRHMAGEWI